jgi:hypothetical protein
MAGERICVVVILLWSRVRPGHRAGRRARIGHHRPRAPDRPADPAVTKLNGKTDKCRTILAMNCLFSGTSVASITERQDRLSPTARSARGAAAPTVAADLTPAVAWSRRVRRIGGVIQAAFAAFWLLRASLAIGGRAEDVLVAVFGVAVIGVFCYAIKVTAGTAPRPAGPPPGQSSSSPRCPASRSP